MLYCAILKLMSGQKGSAHLLILLAALGIILYILFTSTASFKDKLFSTLYPKPPSRAQETSSSSVVSNLVVESPAVEVRYNETDQTYPAGRYRTRVDEDSWNIDRADSLNWNWPFNILMTWKFNRSVDWVATDASPRPVDFIIQRDAEIGSIYLRPDDLIQFRTSNPSVYDQARIIWAKSEGSSDKNFELHRVNSTRMGFGTLSPGQWRTGLQINPENGAIEFMGNFANPTSSLATIYNQANVGPTISGYGAQIRTNLGVGPVREFNFSATGDFSAPGRKNFIINHPTKSGYKLVHSSIEGPETAVYYRGESVLQDGKAVVNLPEYFEALTRKEGKTVMLTPKFETDTDKISNLAASSVKNGEFKVKAIDSNNPSQQFYWEVKAVRGDISQLQVEKKQ